MRRTGLGKRDDPNARGLCCSDERLRTTWDAFAVDSVSANKTSGYRDCVENLRMSALTVAVNETALVRWATSTSWNVCDICRLEKYSKSQGGRRGVGPWIASKTRRRIRHWVYADLFW